MKRNNGIVNVRGGFIRLLALAVCILILGGCAGNASTEDTEIETEVTTEELVETEPVETQPVVSMEDVPTVDGGNKVNSYNDKNSREYIFMQKITDELFAEYEKKLEEAGFARFFVEQIGRTKHEYYYNGAFQVEIRYYASNDHLNLITQPLEKDGERPLFYALVVNDTSVYSAKSDDSSVASKKKYNVMNLVTADGDWYEVSGQGDAKYCKADDVEVFMTLSELKGEAAVIWARDIANDNDFHYGDNKWSHHYGCYFCGTNGTNSVKVRNGAAYEDQLKTYCCNPLVTAAYCHGAGAIKVGYNIKANVSCAESSKNINLANDTNKPLEDKRLWMWFEKPASITDLIPGDLLMTPGHVVIYSGNGKLIEASGGDDNVEHSSKWDNSIREKSMDTSKFNGFTKLVRYIGK